MHKFQATLVAAFIAIATIGAAASSARGAFDLSHVDAIAEALAKEPYDATPRPLPDEAKDWGYDQYRRVRYFPQHSIWFDTDVRYQIQMMPRGYVYKDAVDLFIVEGGEAKPVPFVPEHFEYLAEDDSRLVVPKGLGFAGFRIMRRSGEPLAWWELGSFIGASYWRAVGRDQHPGASVRGLGLDIGGNERFPRFTKFWIVRPGPEDATITVYALLDSDAATGAYRFVIEPGETTTVAVTAHVYARSTLGEACIAPITSMFFRGESDADKIGQRIAPGTSDKPGPPDMRPEVHDSDGLLIHEADGADAEGKAIHERWTWRTLMNPPRPSVNQIGVRQVLGFGLIQRDTAFASYKDREARYDKRPSVWVRPTEPWGPGRIDLLLWPCEHEGIDSVGAWYRPANAEGKRLDLSYSVEFRAGDPVEHQIGRFDSVKLLPAEGGGVIAGEIDVTLPPGVAVTELSPIESQITASAGKVGPVTVKAIDPPGPDGRPSTWRLTFELDPGDAEAIELSGVLRVGGVVVSETWNTTWIRRQK